MTEEAFNHVFQHLATEMANVSSALSAQGIVQINKIID